MGYHLFENPKMGIILGSILILLALISWAFQRERFNKLLLLVGPAVIGLFILLDALVTTDRERLVEATRTIVKAAENEDPDTIMGLISDKFLYKNYLNKAGAEEYIRGYLRRPVIASNTIRQIAVTNMADQRGQVEFRVLTNFDPKGPYSFISLLTTQWRFDYVRDPDGQFRVNTLEMLRMGDQRGIDIFSKGIIY